MTVMMKSMGSGLPPQARHCQSLNPIAPATPQAKTSVLYQSVGNSPTGIPNTKWSILWLANSHSQIFFIAYPPYPLSASSYGVKSKPSFSAQPAFTVCSI